MGNARQRRRLHNAYKQSALPWPIEIKQKE